MGPSLVVCLAGGLLAGAAAAVAASLAALALPSPDDVLLGPPTVAVAALGAGAAAGLLWGVTGAEGRRTFWGTWAALCVASIAGAAVIDRALEGTLFFAAPLAFLVFGVTGVLTPAAARVRPVAWLAVVAAPIAVGGAYALAAVASPEVPVLTLPTPMPPTAVPATAATTPQAAPSPISSPAAPTVDPPGLDAGTWMVAAGSKATFRVREKLARLPLPNEAVVETTAMTGTLRREGPSVVELDLYQLRSDQGNRDRYIRTRMFPNDRTAAFTVSVPAPPAREALQNGETVSGTIEGVLEIDGRATPLTLDGEARYEAGKLYLLGRGSFTWQELGIPPPNVSGIVQVEDTVSFEVLILAVPQ